MRRQNIFTFRISSQEKQLIAELAKHLQRSQSDAVRFAVTKMARELADTNGSDLANRGIPGFKLREECLNLK